MGYILLIILLGVPLSEIALFILVGGEIGVIATVAAVVLTAVAGVVLVRQQGLATLARARAEIENDRLPAGALLEGVTILIAGVLLLVPGFFTDAVGFALLIPPARRAIIGFVIRWLGPRVRVVDVSSRRPPGSRDRSPVIDGEAVEIPEKRLPHQPEDSPWREK